jgi:hypothetical protein
MQYLKFLGSMCVKTALAFLAIAELSIIFFVDFKNYEHDVFVFVIAACMTLYCLFRVNQKLTEIH